MKTNSLSSRVAPVAAILICFGLIAVTSSEAAGRNKNPTSKVYIADVEGFAQIDTGERIDELTKKSVYSAQGAVIETKEKSTNAMVFSNGTGVYFDPDTRLEVRRFVQEPFTQNRQDMEVEPSISTTLNYLPRGTIGICTNKLVAGSTMVYTTPHASVRLKGDNKIVIATTNEGTVVSSLGGEVTVQAGDLDAGGQVIQSGQQALIPSDGGKIQIQPIPSEQMNVLDDKATMACMARKTVYFEARDRKVDGNSNHATAFDQNDREDSEIVAVPVVPSNPPIDFTVSPANIKTK